MQSEVQLEARQQVARYPEGGHHSSQTFDSAGLPLPLDNECIHLVNPETSLGKSTSPVTAVHTGVGAFRTEAYPITGLQLQLMWRTAGQLHRATLLRCQARRTQ